MDKKTLYLLGKKAKLGDEMAMMRIIEQKKKLIQRMSFGDEDIYQYIILKLISGIKNYKF